MDRNLTIALLFVALAIAWGYALLLRLREGYVQLKFQYIWRDKSPWGYWTVIVVLFALEFAIVGFAVRYLIAWL